MLRPLPGPRTRWDLSHGTVLASILLLGTLYGPVRVAYGDVSVGASSGGFLDFEIGGRSGGMAGAQVGSANGVMAQYWNPAALSDLTQPQIGGMHATWLGDLNYEWLGYARPISPKLGVGSLSVAYFHLPSISGVDEFGNPTGDFRVYDMAITMGLARPISRGISVGANARMIRQSLATVSATGASFDFGTTAKLAGATFGAVVQNLGPDLSFDGSAYPLPRQIRFGVSREFVGGRVLLATDYNMPSDYYDDVRVGTEIRAHPNVSLRVGYRHEFGTLDDPANGLSFGLGINFKQLNLDYAMTPSPDFDDVHRLSFGYSFGASSREREPKTPKPEETKPAPPEQTGPKVIAEAKPAPAPKKETAPATKSVPAPIVAAALQAPAPAPAPPAKATPAPTTPSPSAAVATTQGAPVTPVPAPQQPAPAPAPKPAATEYAVVLPSYESKESAQAEVKALELLGFRTKDAQIAKDPKRGGYMITFARMKDRQSAEETVSDLQRMSFRATVEVVQR